MDGVRSFLESSTIHGLSYISTSRGLAKFFWTFVVFSGFTLAATLIYESFQDWNDNPITTTIETLSLKEVTLPKITVCPPKSTFTNLNYDLMMIRNMTLDSQSRSDLTKYAVQLIQDHNFAELIANLSLIEEENRYYNWYNSYTMMNLPYWGPDTSSTCNNLNCARVQLRYNIYTIASSGNLSTRSFGEKFNARTIEKNLFVIIRHIVSPENKINENITLQFEVEKNTMKGIDTYTGELNTRNESYQLKFSPPGKGKLFTSYRDVSLEDLLDLEMDLMPGFRLNWKHSEEVKHIRLFNESNFKR